MSTKTLELGDLYRSNLRSVNPAKFESENFELFSVPAYERGQPDHVRGIDIGSSKVLIEPGDVLLCRIVPHIRRAWVVPSGSKVQQIGSGEWIVLRHNGVDPRYLRHFLLSDGFHRDFMRTVAGVGGSLMRARPAQAAKIRIPLPPLPEQRRIASILDQADELRAKSSLANSRLREIADLALKDAITGAAMVPLGDHLSFLTSGSRGWARYYSAQGSPFIRIQNVGKDELLAADLATVDAPRNQEALRTRTRPGDVLMSITADLGRAAVVPPELGGANISQHLALMRPRGLDSRFLSAYLSSESCRRELMSLNRGATKQGLNFDDVKSIPVPLIPEAQQLKLANLLSLVDKRRRLTQQHLAKLDELFASLQHRAFRGEL